jgi:heme oxygenase
VWRPGLESVDLEFVRISPPQVVSTQVVSPQVVSPLAIPDAVPQTTGLLERMRQRTGPLHRQAERSGVVAALLRGDVTRTAYACLLRNLLPAYQPLEQALRQDIHPVLRGLGHPSLYRAEAIEVDLLQFAGADWASSVPLLPAGKRYADRVTAAATGDGALLIAHCYTRYLGDLSGGQIIGRRLSGLFSDFAPALAFTRFDGIADLREFTAGFRHALTQACARVSDPERIVEEAVTAFQLNIDVSIEVADTIHDRVSDR